MPSRTSMSILKVVHHLTFSNRTEAEKVGIHTFCEGCAGFFTLYLYFLLFDSRYTKVCDTTNLTNSKETRTNE